MLIVTRGFTEIYIMRYYRHGHKNDINKSHPGKQPNVDLGGRMKEMLTSR